MTEILPSLQYQGTLELKTLARRKGLTDLLTMKRNEIIKLLEPLIELSDFPVEIAPVDRLHLHGDYKLKILAHKKGIKDLLDRNRCSLLKLLEPLVEESDFPIEYTFRDELYLYATKKLMILAQRKNIVGRSKMKRDQLIEILEPLIEKNDFPIRERTAEERKYVSCRRPSLSRYFYETINATFDVDAVDKNDGIEFFNVRQLRKLAQKYKIKGRSAMRRKELLEALKPMIEESDFPNE